MPTFILEANHNVAVPLEMDRPKLNLYVEAERQVTVYVLNENGLNVFYAGDNPRPHSHGGFANRHVHDQRIRLPHAGMWYVVIVNRGNEETAVHYELEYR